MESSSKCQSCGTADWEWEADMHAYEPLLISCRGCMVKDVAQDDVPASPGSRISLVPRATAAVMKAMPNSRPKRGLE